MKVHEYISENRIWYAVADNYTMLVITRPYDGRAAFVGNGPMVAVAACSPSTVRAVHLKALELGGANEEDPGYRIGDFFGAYFRDLDRDKLAMFCIMSR
ncbi:MAG: VOC family protein [Deltaproteobacteria bacterium]|nr:VOC family protein [Deltaproteobacteria bacterium]